MRFVNYTKLILSFKVLVMSAHMSADLLLLGRHVYVVQYVSTRSC